MDDRADDPQTVAAIGDSFIPQPAQSITMEDRAGDPQTVAAIRDSFNSLLDQNKPDKSYVMERDTYDYYLSALLQRATNLSENILTLPRRKFSNRMRFKVICDENGPYLARASSGKRVYHRDELFNTIFDAHCKCNHGDGRKTYGILKEFAGNIFLWQCLLVTKLCFCKRTKSKASKARGFASPQTKAGDLHLINMVDNPDKAYEWLMLYRDDATKFLFARPLKTRDISEISFELIHLFLNHGAPLFINASLSKVFISKLLKKIYSLWPTCPTVYGHQILYDNHTEFVKNLEKWMADTKSNLWSVGCSVVTSALNSQFSKTLGSTPYLLMHRTTLDIQVMSSSRDRFNEQNQKCDAYINENDDTSVDNFEDNSVEHYEDISVDHHYGDTSFASGKVVINTAHGIDNSAVVSSEEMPEDPQVTHDLSMPSLRFPMCESEDVGEIEHHEFMSRLKVIENPGGGECLFYVFRQHWKAFNHFEYRTKTVRLMLSEFLSQNELGIAFLKYYHQDVDVNDLAINRGNRSSWGGPETLLAISQVFNVQVTVLSYIRNTTMMPYLTKYWPSSSEPPERNDLPSPSASSVVIRYEKLHYTLLLPVDLTFPPKRFKRERSTS